MIFSSFIYILAGRFYFFLAGCSNDRACGSEEKSTDECFSRIARIRRFSVVYQLIGDQFFELIDVWMRQIRYDQHPALVFRVDGEIEISAWFIGLFFNLKTCRYKILLACFDFLIACFHDGQFFLRLIGSGTYCENNHNDNYTKDQSQLRHVLSSHSFLEFIIFLGFAAFS